jgi:hypothetical protein
MAAKPVRFYVSAGLLYPSALGAALAWLAPACVDTIRSKQGAPAPWSIAFAIWFVAYHATWFVHLTHAAEDTAFEYSGWPFTSDLVDVFAVFAAFLFLGLAWPSEEPYVAGVYATAILIPLSAIIERGFGHEKRGWALLGVAAGTPLIAIVAIPRANANSLVSLDWIPLGVLYVLLAIYFVVPHWFESRRAGPRKRSTGGQNVART